MAQLKTSASFYRRGIPNSYAGFANVAQANYSIPQPINKFIATNSFFNRNIHSVIYGKKIK
jgi:hypothetical protein